jgi:hypothetical protein
VPAKIVLVLGCEHPIRRVAYAATILSLAPAPKTSPTTSTSWPARFVYPNAGHMESSAPQATSSADESLDHAQFARLRTGLFGAELFLGARRDDGSKAVLIANSIADPATRATCGE